MPRTVSRGEFVLAKIINECVNHKETSGDINLGLLRMVDKQHKINLGVFWIMEKNIAFCKIWTVLTIKVSFLTDPIDEPKAT